VFFPFSRIIALVMAAVLCFMLLVPMALARHNVTLALFVSAVFLAYLVANVVLWRHTRSRG
jgi:amino acid transporter